VDGAASASHPTGSFKQQFTSIKGVFRNSSALRATLVFCVVVHFLPSYEQAMFWFFLDDRKFSNIQMGSLTLVSSLMQALVIVKSVSTIRDRTMFSLYSWGTLAACAVVVFPLIIVYRTDECLGVPAFFWAIIGDAAEMLIVQTFLLPVRLLVVQTSDEATRGVSYAFVLSIINLATFVNSILNKLFMSAFGIDHFAFEHIAAFIMCCWSIHLVFMAIYTYLVIPKRSVEVAVVTASTRTGGGGGDGESGDHDPIVPSTSSSS